MERYMRKFILGLAIALAACNITSAKEYITLESPAGNTIVDEKGSWILGPDMYPLYWTTSKGGIFMRYSYEFKRKAIELFYQGK